MPVKHRPMPDLLFLRRVLRYQRETGFLFWREKIGPKIIVGNRADTKGSIGYRSVNIGRISYLAHRIIWFLVTGEIPDLVDHKDGNRSNNAWKNLRLATHQQNLQNGKLRKSNTSGYKGVSFDRKTGRFRAVIRVENKLMSLGYFSDPIEAHKTYCKAARKYHRSFARYK